LRGGIKRLCEGGPTRGPAFTPYAPAATCDHRTRRRPACNRWQRRASRAGRESQSRWQQIAGWRTAPAVEAEDGSRPAIDAGDTRRATVQVTALALVDRVPGRPGALDRLDRGHGPHWQLEPDPHRRAAGQLP